VDKEMIHPVFTVVIALSLIAIPVMNFVEYVIFDIWSLSETKEGYVNEYFIAF